MNIQQTLSKLQAAREYRANGGKYYKLEEVIAHLDRTVEEPEDEKI
ncbi:MAG: hypothetical protein LBL34_02830 [Clostridiales bacterium]|nr:hypothetical protein [Clostridiales bacterium]